MATNPTFGQWLKAERERKNLTASALARGSGVTPQYIHNLEKDAPTKNNKRAQPSSDVCVRLARALGVHYLEALRAAGHVPDDIPESEVATRMAADYVNALPPEKQDEAVTYLKFLFENFGDESKIRERSPKHSGVVQDGEIHPDPLAATPPQMEQRPRLHNGAGTDADPERAAENGGKRRR